MKTSWKKQLTASGLLCSLLIACTTGGLSAAEKVQEINTVGGNGVKQTSPQASVWADISDLQNQSTRSGGSENAPVQTEFVLDDEEAVFSNGWGANTTDQLDERFGNRFAYAGGVGEGSAPTATATWEKIEIQQDGWYQFYARWTAHENRASNAPYTIAWGDQSVTVTANQKANGGIWNALQSVKLKAGDILTVTLSNNADGYVIADGIRIVWIEDINDEERYTVTVEANEAGGSVQGKCIGLTAGETTTLTAVPSEGWQFAGWLLDGQTVCEDAVYALTVTGDLTLTARFEKIPVDKDELTRAISAALDAQEKGAYALAVPSIQRTFAELLDAARQLYDSDDALQKEVNEAAERLSDFLRQPILQAADKKALEEAIACAEQAQADGLYDKALPSVQRTLSDLLADAKLAYGQEDALQEEVNGACAKLIAFLDSPIPMDTDKFELAFVIEYAEGLHMEVFAEAGKQAFTDALQSAKAVYDRADADQETVDSAMLELLDKTADLRIASEN